MSKTAIMEHLKKALGESLSEEATTQIGTYLDTLVTDRSKAATLDASTKLESVTKELEGLKQKIAEQETAFKTEAEAFAGELAEAFKKKENILFEELENYKSETLKVVETTATEYRAQVEQMVEQVADEYKTGMDKYRESLESVMAEEASNFRKQQEAALAKDVKAYREDLLEKLDKYLESQLTEAIPSEVMEAAVKAKAYEGLVQGMVETFSKNYIKLDSTGYEALKEAKKENESLAENFNAKVKESVTLTAKVRELEKEVKITKLTEGMTQAQKQRAHKLLESATAADVERKFDAVKDFIIKESVKPTAPVINESKARPQQKQVVTEAAQKQIQVIEENVSSAATGGNDQMSSWKKNLDRMNRRV